METFFSHIKLWLQVGGLAQLLLVAGSLAIPKILKWGSELIKVQLLIKQMFWTYTAYILVINLCFGLLSVFAADALTDGSQLAMLVTGFIAVYWISRVLVQFFYFDRAGFPKGKWHTAGEVGLVALFVFLSLVYSAACYYNYLKI